MATFTKAMSDLLLAEVKELKNQVTGQSKLEKEWYSPDKLTPVMRRTSYTVREWAHLGRIRSEKDPCIDRRKMPVEEVQRLLAGSRLLGV